MATPLRPRRRFGFGGDPGLRLDPTRIEQALAFGDATDQIDRQMGAPEPTPKGSFGQRLLRGLPDAIGYGLAAGASPYDTGFNRFLGAFGRGYVGSQQRRMAVQQQEQEREAMAQKLKMDLLNQTLRQRELDLKGRPEWQAQGYPDFATWREDQQRQPTLSSMDSIVRTTTDDQGNTYGITKGGTVVPFGGIGKSTDLRPRVLPGYVGPGNAPIVLPRTGPPEATVLPLPGGSTLKPSAGQQDELAGLDANLADLQSARTQIGNAGGAFTWQKQLVGNAPLVGGAARRLIARNEAETNPDYIRVRSAVASLNTTIRRLQSGTAVTESEGRALESFLGDEWKDSPATLQAKLDGVERWIRNKQQASRQQRVVGAPAAADDYSDVDLDE